MWNQSIHETCDFPPPPLFILQTTALESRASLFTLQSCYTFTDSGFIRNQLKFSIYALGPRQGSLQTLDTVPQALLYIKCFTFNFTVSFIVNFIPYFTVTLVYTLLLLYSPLYCNFTAHFTPTFTVHFTVTLLYTLLLL